MVVFPALSVTCYMYHIYWHKCLFQISHCWKTEHTNFDSDYGFVFKVNFQWKKAYFLFGSMLFLHFSLRQVPIQFVVWALVTYRRRLHHRHHHHQCHHQQHRNFNYHYQASANTIRGLGTGHIPETAYASNVLKEVNVKSVIISKIIIVNTVIMNHRWNVSTVNQAWRQPQ